MSKKNDLNSEHLKQEQVFKRVKTLLNRTSTKKENIFLPIEGYDCIGIVSTNYETVRKFLKRNFPLKKGFATFDLQSERCSTADVECLEIEGCDEPVRVLFSKERVVNMLDLAKFFHKKDKDMPLGIGA